MVGSPGNSFSVSGPTNANCRYANNPVWARNKILLDLIRNDLDYFIYHIKTFLIQNMNINLVIHQLFQNPASLNIKQIDYHFRMRLK